MADYSLTIVGLIQPTQPSYLQAYRPTLAVQNTGKKLLTLGGYFSVYERQAPGKLIFQSGFIAADAAPGQTAQLLGEAYWTPPATATYTVAAHVTTQRPGLFKDLGPLALVVSPDEPPEPPIVTAHATQHETDGVDELNVTNLRGELYDPQSPKSHASRHEVGGTDLMSVEGLHGELADPQPTSAHGNEKHTSPFVDVDTLVDAIDTHNDSTAAHSVSTNLEQVDHKGDPNGYAPLDANARLPLANLPPTPLDWILSSGKVDTLGEKIQLQHDLELPRDGTFMDFVLGADLTATAGPNTFTVYLKTGPVAGPLTTIGQVAATIAPGIMPKKLYVRFTVQVLTGDVGCYGIAIDNFNLATAVSLPTLAAAAGAWPMRFQLSVALTGLGSTVWVYQAVMLRPLP